MGKLQQQVPQADSVAAYKAALRAEFGSWSIIYTTDTGRWWATRTSGCAWLDGSPGGGGVTGLDAATAEDLGRDLGVVVAPRVADAKSIAAEWTVRCPGGGSARAPPG